MPFFIILIVICLRLLRDWRYACFIIRHIIGALRRRFFASTDSRHAIRHDNRSAAAPAPPY